MRLTFYGAAGEVTGSKHLIDTGSHRLLLDCGLEQGKNASPHQGQLAFDPRSIDAVIISHAHLDHIGLLPVLVQQGYRGRIYSTSATRDLSELILLDSAHLQEQDAAYAQKKKWPGYEAVQPLYTTNDIPNVMAQWTAIPYQFIQPGWTEVTPGIKVKLYDAGHILGSAVTVVDLGDQRLAYSGDLGRNDAPLLRDPDPITDEVRTLILESTYGTRSHHPVASVTNRLVDAITGNIHRGGKIIVPAFSLGRTQELVYLLHQLTDAGRLPRFPIVVDSPLASRITEVFARHQRDYDAAVKRDFTRPNEDPLTFSNLRYTHTVEESKALNSTPGPMMIISASGMASGGRVMHHLANNLADGKNTILFTGYQANGTLGRAIVSGAKRIHLFGQSIPVRAQVLILNDLSAHADGAELERYAASVPGLKNIFLVHGEPDRAAGLQASLKQTHP
ncbi:MAG: MBL fold metallo-hydrolase, partial [Patescibacteria group bacterium]